MSNWFYEDSLSHAIRSRSKNFQDIKNRRRRDVNQVNESENNTPTIWDKARERRNQNRYIELHRRAHPEAYNNNHRAPKGWDTVPNDNSNTNSNTSTLDKIKNMARNSPKGWVDNKNMSKLDKIKNRVNKSYTDNYNSVIKKYSDYYYNQLSSMRGTALTEFVRQLNLRITNANRNGATKEEIAEIEGIKDALNRMNR